MWQIWWWISFFLKKGIFINFTLAWKGSIGAKPLLVTLYSYNFFRWNFCFSASIRISLHVWPRGRSAVPPGPGKERFLCNIRKQGIGNYKKNYLGKQQWLRHQTCNNTRALGTARTRLTGWSEWPLRAADYWPENSCFLLGFSFIHFLFLSFFPKFS